jgi:penicillin-binding protein 1A
VATNDDFVPFERLPPALLRAFVTAEDPRFYEHDGINIHATIHSLLTGSESGGPRSTITQTLAKMQLGGERSFGSKVREAFLARELESRYSKDEILTLYVNRVFLGHGAYGVAAAARRYFGKRAQDLDVAQCALLAGLARAPADTSPLEHPDAALARRNQVLEKMVELGALGRDDANRWLARPLL